MQPPAHAAGSRLDGGDVSPPLRCGHSCPRLLALELRPQRQLLGISFLVAPAALWGRLALQHRQAFVYLGDDCGFRFRRPNASHESLAFFQRAQQLSKESDHIGLQVIVRGADHKLGDPSRTDLRWIREVPS